MPVEFLKLAEQELYDAQAYYEKRQENLGSIFKEILYKAIKRVVNFPKSYEEVKPSIRKCTIHKFPYNILYSARNDKILIIAITNHKRKPNYWVNRINNLSTK